MNDKTPLPTQARPSWILPIERRQSPKRLRVRIVCVGSKEALLWAVWRTNVRVQAILPTDIPRLEIKHQHLDRVHPDRSTARRQRSRSPAHPRSIGIAFP